MTENTAIISPFTFNYDIILYIGDIPRIYDILYIRYIYNILYIREIYTIYIRGYIGDTTDFHFFTDDMVHNCFYFTLIDSI